MLVDLVQVTTRDGVRLDGIYQAPTSLNGPVDAFCLVHGTGSNFYGSTLFDTIAERLLKLGYGILRINTRGHDSICTASTARGGQRLGAAYEIVDDCRHDLAAWVSWLGQRAGGRIGLLGHSSGALKVLYALAQEMSLPVNCAVALSPPRLSYSHFCSGPEAGEFLRTYQQAEQIVQTGQPAQLMEVKLPLPFVVTAAGYVEKYGPDERYNVLRFLKGVKCPTLFTFGSKEVADNMAFRELPALVREMGHIVEMIEGADHFYTNLRGPLCDRLESWLQAMPR